MVRRIVAVAVVFTGLSACTSAPATTVKSESGSSISPGASALASGLRPVSGYAQEFCPNGITTSCPKGAVPDALRRPLRIPSIEPEAPCPLSQPNPHIWSRSSPGLGPGPVSPVGLGEHAVLRFRRFRGSDWGGQKVLWVAAPGYDGPALIRGGRLDANGGVGFNVHGNGPPLQELQLPPGPTLNIDRGYREWPSYTRVTEPGCYAYQVDGTGFSYVIVFRATPLA
jgi:hypothetical protein